MWRSNGLTRRLGVALPMVQAPLGGGPGTPELTAAAAEAGLLGMVAAGYLDPPEVHRAVQEVARRTRNPFGVNVFLAPPPRRVDARATRDRLLALAAELGLPAEAPVAPRGLPDVHDQVAVLLEERVKVVSFTFGCPDEGLVRALHDVDVLVMVTVGTVEEARLAESAAVSVPVVAAGGLMDGRGVAAALALGAAMAQLGTAFLRTAEAGTDAAYREALRASDGATVTTAAFSGRVARGLPNDYLRAFGTEADLPDFPVMHYLTRPLRTASAQQGRAAAQSLWAGQGVASGRDLPAAELVAALVDEVEATLRRLSGP